MLSLPHGYYRIIEHSSEFHPNETNIYCANSKFLDEPFVNFYFIKFSLEQINLIYTIVISYIIPLTSIVICYAIMMNKLRKETPAVSNCYLRQY